MNVSQANPNETKEEEPAHKTNAALNFSDNRIIKLNNSNPNDPNHAVV